MHEATDAKDFLGSLPGNSYQERVLHPGESLDGYRLLRLVGSGGFGEIWICQSEALGDLRALKFIPGSHAGRLEKEFHALGLYRNAAGRLRSPALMPIEHANLRPDGLFYIMPLADGMSAGSPEEEDWRPATLDAMILRQRTEPAWFTSRQVEIWMLPILEGLQLLSDAGLVHRDVKPDNILFLNGAPCLSDISLLGEDAQQLTRRGTPGFSAPSWFVESGGHPDMYGAAMTLYSLLSGNLPDKMGRANFRWPPQGEQSLSPEEREAWLGMHAAIRRAIEDRPAERFADFNLFARALTARGMGASDDRLQEEPSVGESFPLSSRRRGRSFFPVFGVVLGFVLALLTLQAVKMLYPGKPEAVEKEAPKQPSEAARAEIQAFEKALADAAQKTTFPREKFAAEMEAVAADLFVLNPENPVTPGAQQKPLSEIKKRFLDALNALPPKPDVSTQGRVVSELREAVDKIASRHGSALRGPLEEKVRKFESELHTDAEFRKEQGMKVLKNATRLVNLRPESWDIIQPAQIFSFKGEL